MNVLKVLPVVAATLLIAYQTAQAQYNFSMEKEMDCTEVKSQDKTGTCWSFATTSFLESELIREGKDEYDLSEMYFVRQNYIDKARNYLLRQGTANFSEGSLSHDVINVIGKYGAMPESAYRGLVGETEFYDHSELITVLKGTLDGYLKNKTLSDTWYDVVNGILDAYMGPVPANFAANGSTLTPEEYAAMLDVDGEEYLSLTSFTHHPFYEQCILELPDNYSNGSYYNVPLEELVATVDQALQAGYTIAWDGDVSEPGFSAKEGIAVLPENPKREDIFLHPGEEVSVTQALRQSGFESLRTTDDHLMHITGTASDQNGTKYYIVKNSWGPIGPTKGFLYMSEPYLKMKTIAIMVHEDAVPDAVLKKFKTAMLD